VHTPLRNEGLALLGALLWPERADQASVSPRRHHGYHVRHPLGRSSLGPPGLRWQRNGEHMVHGKTSDTGKRGTAPWKCLTLPSRSWFQAPQHPLSSRYWERRHPRPPPSELRWHITPPDPGRPRRPALA